MPTLAWLRRSAITAGAQGMSSVTNFAAGGLAVGAGSLEEFGRFAIVFQVCVTIVAVSRGTTGITVLIHATRSDARADAIKVGAAQGALLVGAAIGAGLLAIGFVIGGEFRAPLWIAAVGAPGLAVQYTFREALFAAQRPGRVLAIDLVWLGVLLGFAGLAVVSDLDPSANDYLAAWLVGATVSGAPFAAMALAARRSELGTFWRIGGPQAVRTGIDSMLARSVFVVALTAAGWILDTEASGALAAALLAFSPMSVIHSSSVAMVVPGQIRAHGVHVVRGAVPLTVVAVIGSITIAWAVALWVIDATALAVGPFALSDNQVTTALFVAMLARFLSLALLRGPVIALRIADAASEALRARAVGTAAEWSLPILGMFWGVQYGAWGLALASLIGAAETWRRFLRLRTMTVTV